MMALADFAVVVSDAKTTARWFEDNLGFQTFVQGGSGHAILVAPPGERFVMHLCEGAALEPGNQGVAFVTDEFDATVGRLRARGVRFTSPPSQEAWGKRAEFADPDGNVFAIVEAPTPMVQQTLNLRAREEAKARRG